MSTAEAGKVPSASVASKEQPGAVVPTVSPEFVDDDGRVVLGNGPDAGEAPVAEQVVSKAAIVALDNSKAPRALPVEANVATAAERNQTIAVDWPVPQAVLFVSGQQHGYIEPCGCTGLENQKGGLIRRDTLLKELRERGWEIIPVDVGNQVRRIGR
ncbi:MAG: hypothetical protein KDA51_07775, partial [Planctomycetales bacterium]|nr:hypothetical protein [Planctomycetales bacterium]